MHDALHEATAAHLDPHEVALAADPPCPALPDVHKQVMKTHKQQWIQIGAAQCHVPLVQQDTVQQQTPPMPTISAALSTFSCFVSTRPVRMLTTSRP